MRFYLNQASDYIGSPMLSALYGTWAAWMGDRRLSKRLMKEGYEKFITGRFLQTLEYRTDRFPEQALAGPFFANLCGFLDGTSSGIPWRFGLRWVMLRNGHVAGSCFRWDGRRLKSTACGFGVVGRDSKRAKGGMRTWNIYRYSGTTAGLPASAMRHTEAARLMRGELAAVLAEIIERTDGKKQSACEGKPLYLWIQDKAPGESPARGQGGRNLARRQGRLGWRRGQLPMAQCQAWAGEEATAADRDNGKGVWHMPEIVKQPHAMAFETAPHCDARTPASPLQRPAMPNGRCRCAVYKPRSSRRNRKSALRSPRPRGGCGALAHGRHALALWRRYERPSGAAITLPSYTRRAAGMMRSAKTG